MGRRGHSGYNAVVAYREHDSRRKFGVETGPFTGDRVVDLDRLPRGARDALRERIASGTPSPILTATRSFDRILHLTLVAAAVGAVIALAQHRFGDLRGPTQLDPRWALPYVALGIVAFVGAALFVRSVLRDGLSRFPQGTLVYPLDLLVIDGKRMRVRSFGDARYVEAKENEIEIEYVNGEKLRVRGQRHAKASLLVEMLAAQHDLEDASAAGKSTKDVLAEVRASFPWAELAPQGDAPPTRRGLVVAFALLGAALGGGGFLLHARLEDDSLYEQALAKNDAASYRAYLAHGTRHRTEALNEEADVERKRALDDPLALTAVIASYPGTPAATRAETDLRSACRAYVRDWSRTRCEPQLDPMAVDVGATTCVPRKEEQLCAQEVAASDLDHIVHSTDLRSIFIEQKRAANEGRTGSVADMDARIDTLIEEANAELCAVGAPADDLRALHAIARKEKRIATLTVVIPADDSSLTSLLRTVNDGALSVRFTATTGIPSDRVWTFTPHPDRLDFSSRADEERSDRTATAKLQAPKLAPNERERVPGLVAALHALEELGFRPNGPGPMPCRINPLSLRPLTVDPHDAATALARTQLDDALRR